MGPVLPVCALESAAGSEMLQGMMWSKGRQRGGLCLFTVREVINGGPGLPANCQGQCSPERWGVSAEEEKNPYPTGGLILSIHKRTRSHEFIENSMQGRKSLACGRSTHM